MIGGYSNGRVANISMPPRCAVASLPLLPLLCKAEYVGSLRRIATVYTSSVTLHELNYWQEKAIRIIHGEARERIRPQGGAWSWNMICDLLTATLPRDHILAGWLCLLLHMAFENAFRDIDSSLEIQSSKTRLSVAD